MMFLARGWWKLLNAVLAVAFIATAIVSFVIPATRSWRWPRCSSFFLVFAGAFASSTPISARRESDAWWLQLVGGIIELALGFWATGYWGRAPSCSLPG
mgnify:CR=1 FL=1